jgi:hypothetical protein
MTILAAAALAAVAAVAAQAAWARPAGLPTPGRDAESPAPAMLAQATDPQALRREFRRGQMQGEIDRLERESLRGDLDAAGQRDLLERRSTQRSLGREPDLAPLGPYRSPGTVGVLLESPPNPILGR